MSRRSPRRSWRRELDGDVGDVAEYAFAKVPTACTKAATSPLVWNSRY